jgi:hypothetical protein
VIAPERVAAAAEAFRLELGLRSNQPTMDKLKRMAEAALRADEAYRREDAEAVA